MKVKLRPLVESDAMISYKWRNNPLVWQYTANQPDIVITPEIETAWIKKVLLRTDERRFAILANGVYVGNAYLTSISEADAELHIFIGDTDFWGRGIGTQALNLLIDFARRELSLKYLHLRVHLHNTSAYRMYQKAGFYQQEIKDDFIFMNLVL